MMGLHSLGAFRAGIDRGGQGPHPTPEHGVWARGIVERARFIGKESLVEFRMDFDGSTLSATVPSVFLPKPGTPLWIAIRRDRCFVFPYVPKKDWRKPQD